MFLSCFVWSMGFGNQSSLNKVSVMGNGSVIWRLEFSCFIFSLAHRIRNRIWLQNCS